MDGNGIYPKIPEKEVEDAAIKKNEVRLWVPPHLVVRPNTCHRQWFLSETPAERGGRKPNQKCSGTEYRGKGVTARELSELARKAVSLVKETSCIINGLLYDERWKGALDSDWQGLDSRHQSHSALLLSTG